MDFHSDNEPRHEHHIVFKKVNIPVTYPPQKSLPLRSDSMTFLAAANGPDTTASGCSTVMSTSSSAGSLPSTTSSFAIASGFGGPRKEGPDPIDIPRARRSSRQFHRGESMPTLANHQSQEQQGPQSHQDSTGTIPSPPISPWQSSSFKLVRSIPVPDSADKAPYPDLPNNVRAWTSSHVATYLGHCLRLYPRAVTEDLARYVRQNVNMTGAQFVELQDSDLAQMQINLKWRHLILQGVRALRRETMQASLEAATMRWEDGFDPVKDGNGATSSDWSGEGNEGVKDSVEEEQEEEEEEEGEKQTKEDDQVTDQALDADERFYSSKSTFHSVSSATATTKTITTTNTMDQAEKQKQEIAELRKGIVQDITGILADWRIEQEEAAEKAKAKAAASSSSLGFMEGIVIGGLIVAFMMRFSR